MSLYVNRGTLLSMVAGQTINKYDFVYTSLCRFVNWTSLLYVTIQVRRSFDASDADTFNGSK